MFEYYFEEELKKHLIQNFNKYFDFRFTAEEYSLSKSFKKGLQVDLIGEDDENEYLIEIKRDYANASAVKQLKKYLHAYDSDKKLIGIIVSPEIKKSAYIEAGEDKNIIFKKLKSVKCLYVPKYTQKNYFLGDELYTRLKEFMIKNKTYDINTVLEIGLNSKRT